MTRLAMSRAASGLLRALLRRVDEFERVLLTECRSVDWQSLTFVGERHEFELRLSGPDAERRCDRLTDGLADAELQVPGHFIADIAVQSRSEAADGSIELTIEALTIAD